MLVRLGHTGRLRVYLSDGYWVPLILPGYQYEPEVHYVFERTLRGRRDVVFLDCGANIGYWSIVALDLLGDDSQVVAVEPFASVFPLLQENAQLNANRIVARQAALWSMAGSPLVVAGSPTHDGAAKVIRAGEAIQEEYHVETVSSITLDALADEYVVNADTKIVVKLDVEGSEIPAMVGGSSLLREKEPLIVYEDHGADARCLPTEYALTSLQYDVYYCDGRSLGKIHSVDQVRRLKVNPYRGYNFFACKPGSYFGRELEGFCNEVEEPGGR